MAKNNNLTDFLTGVADAIRTKKGTSDLINPQNFESEISSIKTEKAEQEKSVAISTNGTTEVTPDSGKVLSKVSVTTNVQPTLQEKTVAPTTTQQIVTADSGKDGLSKVTVEAVTSSIDSNIVAENIKKDVTILGVTGTLESGSSGTPIDIATEEEMASILSNATADDNGKIYRYTGTTGTYVNGALYWLEVPQEPAEDALAGTWVFNGSSSNMPQITVDDCTRYYASGTYGSENSFDYVELSPDQTYFAFGLNGWWDITTKKYGAGANEITITSKLSEVTNGQALLTWLQSNATKQST